VEFAISSGTLLLLRLRGRGLPVCLTRNRHIPSGRSRRGSTVPAVVTYAIDRGVVVRNGRVVCVVNDGRIDVGHRGVVPVDIPLPLATIEPFTWIAVPIINTAVEADVA